MAKCANCGATMTCGCQKRTLPNGKQGCSKCATKPVADKKSNTAPTVNAVSIDPFK
jgi:hypothetical protein